MNLPGYYTSGQFARMANISVRTVRFYDKQNILKPSYVSPSGSRFYTDQDFARLQQILLLKYLGFSLDDIKEMTIDDTDFHFMLNSLKMQQKLIRDRIEQLGYYTSGQFARMANISVRTVRFYDKQNILKPSYVSPSGSRFYTDQDFARLQQILLLKYLGFSLDDIKEMTIDDTDFHFMLNSLKMQQKLIRDRIEQLQMVEKAIEDTTQEISTGD